jgi:translation initiation factor IF-3
MKIKLMAKSESIRCNNQITADSIVLIDENEVKIGIVTKSEALKIAESKDLDLIEITQNKDKNQSVCHLGILNKYLYEKKRKEKEQLKIRRDNTIITKEIYLRPNTDHHDIEIKAKKALSFIESGNRVKTLLKIKNRENSHRDIAEQTMITYIAHFLPDDIEKPMYYEGNNLVIILFKK